MAIILRHFIPNFCAISRSSCANFGYDALTRDNSMNIFEHKRLAHRLIAPFRRCCRELRPFSYMSGPSRVQSESLALGPPRKGWLGRPASHCGDAVACTTFWRSNVDFCAEIQAFELIFTLSAKYLILKYIISASALGKGRPNFRHINLSEC